MRPGVPWSVKGIEPEAREAAKQAARRAGMTLGAWLNDMIMQQGTDEVGPDGLPHGALPPEFAALDAARTQPQAPQPPFMQPAAYAQPAPYPPQIDLSPVTDAVRDLVQRMDSNERRLEGSISALAERMDENERMLRTGSGSDSHEDKLERKVQQLTDRLEAAEKSRGRMPFGGRAEDRLALQGLEKTMNAVVEHLETVDNQSERKFDEVRETLSQLAERLEATETAAMREQEQAKTDALGNTLQNLSERLGDMESRLAQTVQSVQAGQKDTLEAAIQAVTKKLDSDQQRSRVENLQTAIDKLGTRLQRSEAQHAESLTALESSLTSFVKNLEARQISADDIVPQVMTKIDGRMEEMVSRVTESETRAMETASSVEQALSALAQSISDAESRDAQARDNVAEMVQSVASRLDSLESGRKLPLSPTVAVGAGLAGMPPPSLDDAPLPPAAAPPLPLSQPEGPAPKLEARSDAPSPPPPASAKEPLAPPPGPPPAVPPVMGPPAMEPPLMGPPEMGPPPMPGAPLAGPPPAADPIVPPPGASPFGPPPPPLDETRSARDFVAAARRAAQSAQAMGETSSLGFGEGQGRYAAFEGEDDNRLKRLALIIGGSLLALILVLGLVSWLRASDPADGSLAPVADLNDPFADEFDEPVDALSALVPDASETDGSTNNNTQLPEATPEDAGTPEAAAVPASTNSEVAETEIAAAPAPLPSPRIPASAPPRAIVPNSDDLPPVEAAPTTPVVQAPAAPVTPRNPLRAAATAGNAAAQYEVGLRYARGGGVPQDYAQAAYWLELAANQDLAIAQYRLATLYEKGRGVSEDAAKARDWYERAAQAGNVKAMHNLAVIHAEGKGVTQDFAAAAQWFMAAADHGLADSQYNIAVLYERGLGVTADPQQAYQWFAIAANNGDEGAATRRDALADQLDATALVDAQLAAQTWSPKAADAVANGNLSSLTTWESSSETTSSISAAQSRPDVARAQTLLREMGYQPGPADGLMGPRTRDAIADFQQAAGLEATGIVDPVLIQTLEAYVR